MSLFIGYAVTSVPSGSVVTPVPEDTYAVMPALAGVVWDASVHTVPLGSDSAQYSSPPL